MGSSTISMIRQNLSFGSSKVDGVFPVGDPRLKAREVEMLQGQLTGIGRPHFVGSKCRQQQTHYCGSGSSRFALSLTFGSMGGSLRAGELEVGAPVVGKPTEPGGKLVLSPAFAGAA